MRLQPPRRHLTLRRPSSTPVWLQIGWRVLFVLGLIALAIAVHWFDREGLKDNADGHISFVDIIYFTMISITTTGYGDIAPVTERARLFDALVVTPIRVFAILVFVGTAYSFVIRRTWDKWRMSIIQKNLSGHMVVAGFGVTGREAVEELIARGTDPASVVVVDCLPDALDEAEALGCTVLQGDATRDATLEAVRIAKAGAMIVTAGRDDTSILITLTARHLAPELRISTTVRAEDNELLARQAGATTVVNPVSFAGLLLAGSCKGTHATEYIADLASAAGRVQLIERPVTSAEAGRPLSGLTSGLGVRILRRGQPYGFWEPEAQKLELDDIVVEIVPTARLT
jgi:voltage-gated potassium channel